MKLIQPALMLSVQGDRGTALVNALSDVVACEHCGDGGHCGCGRAVSPRPVRLRVSGASGLAPGEEVLVETDLPSPARAAFELFIVPMVVAGIAGAVTLAVLASTTLALSVAGTGFAAVYVAIFIRDKRAAPRARVLGKRSAISSP